MFAIDFERAHRSKAAGVPGVENAEARRAFLRRVSRRALNGEAISIGREHEGVDVFVLEDNPRSFHACGGGEHLHLSAEVTDREQLAIGIECDFRKSDSFRPGRPRDLPASRQLAEDSTWPNKSLAVYRVHSRGNNGFPVRRKVAKSLSPSIPNGDTTDQLSVVSIPNPKLAVVCHL